MANTKEIIQRLKSGDLPLDFNWNSFSKESLQIHVEPTPAQVQSAEVLSECLRDGLHGIKEQPGPKARLEYAKRLYSLGIKTMTVGIYPGEQGESNKVDKAIKTLLADMHEELPEVTPVVLTLATEPAFTWTATCHEINPKLNSIAFMGSAPSRMLVENWDQDFVLSKMRWLVSHLRAEGIGVIGATEHTTQTPPEFLKQIVQAQVESGASYFCIADTIGTARPIGAARVTTYVRQVLRDMGRDDVKIDWHGHRDTGNELGNAMAALAAGANRVHVVSGGIGERAGNLSLESVLINFSSILAEAGLKNPWNIKELNSVVDTYRSMVKTTNSEHGPLARNAFVTSLGIHTAAMLKAEELVSEAERQDEAELAEKLRIVERTVYSAIDPDLFGRKHEIVISPWSGASTVMLAAKKMGVEATAEQVKFILDIAKQRGEELTPKELRKYLGLNGH